MANNLLLDRVNQLLIFIITAFVLGSCIKEEFQQDIVSTKESITPSVGLPVGFTKFNLEKYLNGSGGHGNLFADQDGFLTLRYQQNIFSITAQELFVISPANFSGLFINESGTSMNLAIGGSPVILRDTVFINLGFENGQHLILDSIQLNTGTLSINSQTN